MTDGGVLLVDDDLPFRALARDLLRRWGFRLTGEAGTGLEALDAAARLRPGVVLLDVQLGDLDGFEVTRRLRAAGSVAAIILISTREAADYGRRVDDCGALGFITKSRLSRESLRAILASGGDIQ